MVRIRLEIVEDGRRIGLYKLDHRCVFKGKTTIA